jgi:lipopolysaccharide export system permease protein
MDQRKGYRGTALASTCRALGTARRHSAESGDSERMGSITRYIFRTTLGAFLVVLVSLTALIWVTQALRDIDLMTNQGQSILIFIAITGLIVPLLVLVIAPIALVIAVIHVLNKLSTDSEIVVMNAAGMSPWRLFRAFLTVGILVSVLMTAISAYFAPEGLRALRRWITAVRADLVTNIVQPGRFINIERGLVFHFRERKPDGQMLGIFLDDRRDPNERATFLAEQGEILETGDGTFLVLENGSVQRRQAAQRDPTIVRFDRYAFDLSRLASGQPTIKYSVRERYLWELIAPDPNDPLLKELPGQFRAEFHDRILAPFYPIAFVVIAYAYLGAPRTSRQSRALSLLGAVGMVAAVRLIGFASTVFGVHVPFVLTFQYVALIAALAFGIIVISRGVVLEPPAFVINAINALAERFARRAAAT